MNAISNIPEVNPVYNKYKKYTDIWGNTFYMVDDERNNWFNRLDGYLGIPTYTYDDDIAKIGRQVSSTNEDVTRYLNNLTDDELLALINNEYGGDIGAFQNDVRNLSDISSNIPELPTYENIANDVFSGNDPVVNAYLEELQADEDRQTSFFQQQLSENSDAFNNYRQQILSNQYQQNSQLMQTVGSEMSRARRNAIEAGASAGLRIAENVNTILSTQNKQSQLSLETSNQLAQQLLNQRQAAAGIRSGYSDMLSQNSAERRGYKEQAIENRYNRETTDYNSRVDNWNSQFDPSSNALAGGYQSYLQTKNAKNKSQSQYN